MLLSKRLLCNVDYLIGLSPATPPRQFTRRVLLRKAYLHCALSAVSQDGPLPPPSSRGVSSFEPGKLGVLPCWCGHRADVRLIDSEIIMKRNIVDVGVGGGTDAMGELPPAHVRGDQGKRDEASVTTAEGCNEARIGTAPCIDDQDRRSSSSSAGRKRLLQDSEREDSELFMTARVLKIFAPSSPQCLEEHEDKIKQERGGERTNARTASKLITIDSLTYRRGLKWAPRSSPEDSCGKEDRTARDMERAEGQSLPAQLLEGLSQSRMYIDVRARHIALSLPPRYQLGNLHAAALLQWKGIQAALGECSVFLRGHVKASMALLF